MNRETLYDLRALLALYPYYQTARLLMLKNLYLLHDPSAKHYADAFKMSGKKVVKIGLNFSVKDEVNSLEWKIVS